MVKPIITQDIVEITTRLKDILPLLERKKVLISGGAGFIGRYILYVLDYANQHLFHAPCHVICVDNFSTSEKSDVFYLPTKNFTYFERDVSKPLKIRRRVHYIIHAAGIASPIYYKKFPLEAIEVNTMGTRNLLELAKINRVASFLYFSSSEIYGDPDAMHIPTPETYRGNVSSIGPRACYDESKRLGEALTVNYSDVYNVPTKIVRPFNVYGPGMRVDDYRVIPAFLYRALRGKPLEVHDTGKQTRTYCYISDAIVALLKVLLKGKNKEVYNVGNDEPEINTLQLAKLIKGLLPKNRVKINFVPYPASYPQDVPQRRRPDLTKIQRQLSYRPLVDLETGILRTLTWFKELTTAQTRQIFVSP